MTLPLDITWPAALPLPFLDYSGQAVNGTLVGTARNIVIERRSRFERSYREVGVEWRFDPEQYEAFKAFFYTTLGNGTAQFKIELRFPLNSDLTEWAARIAGGFDSVYDEGVWRVAASMDLVNPVEF